MSEILNVRESFASDLSQIADLYRRAFAGQDLGPLLADLLAERNDVRSLVFDDDGTIAGHVAFSLCSIDEKAHQSAALLGPLAVLPERQRQGIGAALVREGLNGLARDGVMRVFVLGDPAYYGRLGFTTDHDVSPPYPLPLEWRAAWQALNLGDGNTRLKGQLVVPEPWRRPELWMP